MSHFFKISQLICLCLLSGGIHAQNSIRSVDLTRIKQNKVKSFILNQQNNNIEYFSDLEASVNQSVDLSDFMNYEKTYIIKEERDVVWDNYKYADQTDIWDIHRVSVGMLFCRESQSIIYADQSLYGLAEGQIYYLNLKVLNGLYSLPVAFEVINVDHDKKLFEFSYLKGGKAKGKQSIQFIETDEGYTKIIHRSCVKSNSKFRDKYIYPFFHNKIINEFHANMKRVIVKSSKNSVKLLAGLE